jgi:hypothetical protein
MSADTIARLTDSEPPIASEPRALRRICSWCVDWDPTSPRNHGATHVICPSCAARIAADLQARASSVV